MGAIGDQLQNHTVPLLATDHRKKVYIDGCAILLELCEKHYLVTAHHVGQDVHYAIDAGGNLSLSDFGRIVNFPELDITVHQVVNPEALTRSKRLRFVRGSQILRGLNQDNPNLGHNFAVWGYPSSRAKQLWANSPKIEAKPFGFYTRLLSPTERKEIPNNPDYCVLCRFGNEIIFDSETGQKRRPPKLEGISGSGLWLITVEQVLLVGITIEMFPASNPKAIIATRIDFVLEAIKHGFGATIPESPTSFPHIRSKS